MTRLRRLTLAVAVGILAGAGGIGVTLVLHGTQHLLFGYDSGTFLQGIEAAPGWRRVAGACVGGLTVGLGWAWLRRSGRPATVSDAINHAAPLPAVRTGLDALLQAVAVGGGASVGREGAPRQVGGAAGAQLADRLGVPAVDRRVLIAAGAGGGLAAVYNVPVAGVIFAVLTLAAVGRTPAPDAAPAQVGPTTRRVRLLARVRAAAPALRPDDWALLIVTTAVATVTAWTVLGSGRVYAVPIPAPSTRAASPRWRSGRSPPGRWPRARRSRWTPSPDGRWPANPPAGRGRRWPRPRRWAWSAWPRCGGPRCPETGRASSNSP